MRLVSSVVILSCLFFSLSSCANAAIPVKGLFVSGEDGYNTYRIPALLQSKSGALLAFCEGRKAGGGDAGDIDLLVKRSEDGGATWSKQQVIWNDAQNTCGNPCPVQDETTGIIYLLSTWNLGTDHEKDIIAGKSKDTRRVYVLSSEDDGKSWSKAKEITETTKLPNWTWYATGPCTGIQLQAGPHKGRLVIPCDHIVAESNKYFSHIIYSDDHGASWKLGGVTPTDQVNECQVAELANGQMMLNMRNYDRNQKFRAVSLSDDGGMTWGPLHRDKALPEPICQASLVRYLPLAAGVEADAPWLLFSNPASQDGRVKMTIRLSRDAGKTWAVAKEIYAGPSAYSDLAVLPNGDIGLFYEGGVKKPYENIIFQRFSLDDLLK